MKEGGKRKKQPNLQEHAFAMKVAYGKPQRDAYIEVFGGDPKTPKEMNALDLRASRLAAREDVATLIADEQKLKGQRISAAEREMAERIRQNLGEAVLKAQGQGTTLKANVLKGTELYLKSTGQFAPEEHILKNGGMADGFTPRGVEGMSDADLRAIIERERRTVEARGDALAPREVAGGDALAPREVEGGDALARREEEAMP